MLRAYSRSIVKAVVATREISTYIPALAYTFAANPTEVIVAHAERAAGESKYPLYKLIRLNFDSVSYTHLDVYKRQDSDRSVAQRRRAIVAQGRD